VGAFHQPTAVIVDPQTLTTLPAEELAAGYAEVVKTGLITGGALWERISAGTAPDAPEVIAGCALAKLRIVAQDELDTGVRQLLNLGHTVGHAIETATGYARYRHGEAVGLGLLAELRLSGAEDLRAEVQELMASAGLPVTLDPSVDVEQVIFATARDKKRVGEGPVPFVLCPEPGGAVFGQRVAPADLRVVTRRAPTAAELDDLIFAFRVCKHAKSNAIVYARGGATVGIGAGQMSRVDSARIAGWKAEAGQGARGSVCASDAFFPFADGLEAAVAAGATAVIQPGGSVRDAEVIAAADAAGMAMVMTDLRHFRH